MNALVCISEARRALANARTIDDVTSIRDKAEAARVYAKAAGESLELQNECAEIKLWAERRAGEILAEMPLNGGDRKSESHDVRVKLSDLGVSAMQSSRWQRIASLPEEDFVAHVEATKAAGKELTSSSTLKLAAQHLSQQVVEQPPPVIDMYANCNAVDSLDALAGKKFACIYADPPWSYGNQATRAATDNHYVTMPVADIAAMPIKDFAADDAHLHLWTTNAFIEDAFAIIRAWGFEYKSMLLWVKPQMGIGNYWRVSHEILLFGIRGKCPFLNHGMKSWIEADRIGHSQKPEVFRTAIEKVSPGPYLELFGRRTIPGWTVFGNQVERNLLDERTAS